jgi:hypothetical protein
MKNKENNENVETIKNEDETKMKKKMKIKFKKIFDLITQNNISK